MKLGCTASEQLDIGPVGRESLVNRGLGLAERCWLKLALQRIERPYPSIALVFDKSLQHGDGRSGPIACHIFYRAKQRRRIAEIRFGQKVSDLKLDAHASLQPAIELEHHLVAEHQRT